MAVRKTHPNSDDLRLYRHVLSLARRGKTFEYRDLWRELYPDAGRKERERRFRTPFNRLLRLGVIEVAHSGLGARRSRPYRVANVNRLIELLGRGQPASEPKTRPQPVQPTANEHVEELLGEILEVVRDLRDLWAA